MFRVLTFTRTDGTKSRILVSDTDTGYTAKDFITMPGVVELLSATNSEVPTGGWTFQQLEGQIEGQIEGYTTRCFALVAPGDIESLLEDCTINCARIISMPETAAKAFLYNMSEEEQQVVSEAIDSLRFYESITEDTKIMLPKEMLSSLPSGIAETMMSVRKTYTLMGTENQEIFQTKFDSEFCVPLPSLDTIHAGRHDAVSSLDLLRVLAPDRKEARPGIFTYRAIYHTPYYKVDKKLRGMVPSYFNWITGFARNDLVDVQPNERHMYKNLQTLICSDLSRYVSEITTGIFMSTTLGALLEKLCRAHDEDAIRMLYNDIKNTNSADASCNLQFTTVEDLLSKGWYIADVCRAIKDSLQVSPDYLLECITKRPKELRAIECDNHPFTLTLQDEQAQQYIEQFIELGYTTTAMQRFLISLCKCAYRVNWGHTGATLAIPGFVEVSQLDAIDTEFVGYLQERGAGKLVDYSAYPLLCSNRIGTEDDEDSMFSNADDDKDTRMGELFTRMDYYITSETAQRIGMDSLDIDYFTTKATTVQSSEAAIVEYWRTVNGDNNIDTFLSSCLLATADPSILCESFIKLCRWGERRPRLLVLQNHPEIRYVFDLNLGHKVDNTTIVNEDDLIKNNGCDYSFAGCLTSTSNPTVQQGQIVAFVLQKDYGNVQKEYLASWLDIGEMYVTNAINIGEFTAVTPLRWDPDNLAAIEDYERKDFNLYLSQENIETGLKNKIQPGDLSAVALLTTPGITNSAGYLRSLRDDSIITTKDRQYDILRRYTSCLARFYSTEGYKINAVRTTLDLLECAGAFYELFKSGDSAKSHVNERATATAMQKLNLDSGSSTPDIQWDTSALRGPFTLICDMEMKSTLPPIEFSDPNVRQVAARANNRIVLLLSQTADKFVFCRKDIRADEVARVKKVDATTGQQKLFIGRKNYQDLSAGIERLVQGMSCSINKKPAVLHESLKDVII